MSAPPVFQRVDSEDRNPGGRLVFSADTELLEAMGGPPGLFVTLESRPVAIVRFLSREDVQELSQALEDWLYDSRPT